ncbi:hypothetical protein HGRIS_000115 [Hohenbuehelia grisea]|uniref:Uncharacterized protein n=1 Tax=Hohenbuehelia grisea TaxID=104357 RepID=A0ABR3JQ42_9AGAR
MELHVVSNRDRVSSQLFDLWFEHVPTEQIMKRFEREITTYERNDLNLVNWDDHPSWLSGAFDPKRSRETMEELLSTRNDELYWAFGHVAAQTPLRREFLIKRIRLHDLLESLTYHILQNIVRSANDLGMACLVAVEKIVASVAELSLEHYINILLLASLSVRAPQLLQEMLLVLNDCRSTVSDRSDILRYAHRHALAVVFDRADEAADECPCDDDGKPKRQRVAPSIAKLSYTDKPDQVKASVRVDAKASAVRLHSHVRLQAASNPQNTWIDAPIVDGVVVVASKGEVTIELNHPLPPEMTRMQWKMYNAGSIATAKAMLDAILRLESEREACCAFFDQIVTSGTNSEDFRTADDADDTVVTAVSGDLNESQQAAVQSCDSQLSLIWGPPGK